MYLCYIMILLFPGMKKIDVFPECYIYHSRFRPYFGINEKNTNHAGMLTFKLIPRLIQSKNEIQITRFEIRYKNYQVKS